MTPALIFLGVGDAATVVTADLTAAAVYKSGGAIVHKREGSPNMRLAMWLIVGSVPMALLGPYLVAWFTDPEDLDSTLKLCIGFALLFAAATYALRLYINLVRRVRGRGAHAPADPHVRPIPTLLVGALGGLLVGITSVGSGSVIMIALLMLYPGPGRGAAGRHGPGAGRAAGLRGRDLQHRPARPGLVDPGALGDRVGARHPDRQQDRAEGPAGVHPPRHRDRAHHVGRGSARQGRLGAARGRLGRDPPRAGGARRRGHGRGGPARVGVAPAAAGQAVLPTREAPDEAPDEALNVSVRQARSGPPDSWRPILGRSPARARPARHPAC